MQRITAAPFPICRRGAENCVIDAQETGGARCPSERALGDRAKYRLVELLSAGEFSLAAYGSRDRDQYGRALSVVYQGGQSVGAVLISEGLARAWEGRRRPWC
ncbi:thermonuclease family protein [Bosea sp. BIWAKO-01]|uniref:thermonuclease family protein n=1 Tax=Bosea sp. BIWAKO-01 TaxID=506668 RepID=UPI00352A1863